MKMSVYLQDIASGMYLRGLSAWTKDPAEALDFGTTSRAIEFWQDNDLLHVRLVLKYENTPGEVVLDVLPPRRTPGPAQSWNEPGRGERSEPG